MVNNISNTDNSDYFQIRDSIDELEDLVRLLSQRKKHRKKIKIDFLISDNKKWNRFNAVFPALPNFISCSIIGQYKTANVPRLRSICFSGGKYGITNINCRDIYATNNTTLFISENQATWVVYASKNANILMGFYANVHEVKAKDNSTVECRTSKTIIHGYDNSFINADTCYMVLEDKSRCKAITSEITIMSNGVTLLASYSSVKIETGVTSALIDSTLSTIILDKEYDMDKIIEHNTTFVFQNGYGEYSDGFYTDPRYYLNNDRIYYKCVHKSEDGIYFSNWNPEFNYTIGKMAIPSWFDKDPEKDCAGGIHISTIEWALKNYYVDYSDMVILEVEVPEDAEIVVPYASTGKLRASKVKVLREVPVEEFGTIGEIYKRLRGD